MSHDPVPGLVGVVDAQTLLYSWHEDLSLTFLKWKGTCLHQRSVYSSQSSTQPVKTLLLLCDSFVKSEKTTLNVSANLLKGSFMKTVNFSRLKATEKHIFFWTRQGLQNILVYVCWFNTTHCWWTTQMCPGMLQQFYSMFCSCTLNKPDWMKFICRWSQMILCSLFSVSCVFLFMSRCVSCCWNSISSWFTSLPGRSPGAALSMPSPSRSPCLVSFLWNPRVCVFVCESASLPAFLPLTGVCVSRLSHAAAPDTAHHHLLHSTGSLLGQRHLHFLLSTANQVLGAKLQVRPWLREVVNALRCVIMWHWAQAEDILLGCR